MAVECWSLFARKLFEHCTSKLEPAMIFEDPTRMVNLPEEMRASRKGTLYLPCVSVHNMFPSSKNMGSEVGLKKMSSP